jgi:hypothetical protein
MKSLLTVFLVLIISISHAQEYYYNGNEKVIIYPALDAYLLFENEALGKYRYFICQRDGPQFFNP